MPEKPLPLTENQIKKLKTIKSHTFNEKKYKILWRKPLYRGKKNPPLGTCDPPHKKNKKITINPKLTQKKLLAVMIDEAFHGCFWPIENDFVDKISDSMSEFLWRAGWRMK